MSEEQEYNKAGLALVDWVDSCEKKSIDPAMVCALLLDKAIDLCFYILGTDQTMKAVDNMMREKIAEYSKAEKLTSEQEECLKRWQEFGFEGQNDPSQN